MNILQDLKTRHEDSCYSLEKAFYADLINEIERLHHALQFYADFVHLPVEADIGSLMMDCGKVAFNALNGTNNVSSGDEV